MIDLNTLNTDVMAQLAEAFAKAMVGAQQQAQREELESMLAFSGTEIVPKPAKKPLSELFPNTDRAFKNPNIPYPINEWLIPHPAISPISNNYHFRIELLQDIMMFLREETDFGLWLSGPKGTGKTSVIEQVTARLGIPLYQETGSPKTEFLDLFGMHVPVGYGKTRFMRGGLLNSMEEGCPFLLNEADAMLPSELIKLNEIVMGKPVFVPQIERWVTPKAGFKFVVTANTNGTGNTTGRMLGTNQMNEAFMDRFMQVSVLWLPENVEVAILHGYINELETKKGLARDPNWQANKAAFEAFCTEMVNVAGRIRAAAASQRGASSDLSIRGLQRWLLLAISGTQTEGMSNMRAAFLKAYGNSLSEAEKITALELCEDVFGNNF